MKFFIVVLAAIAANLGLVNACAFSRQCCSDLTHEVHVMRDDIRGIGKNVAMLVSGRTAATRPNTATEATEATSITEASETTVPATTEAATVQKTTEATSITEASETTVPATTEAATEQRCRGVIFEGQCFFALDRGYNFDPSQTACSNLSATFAPIVSIAVYDALESYLRGIVSSYGFFRFALRYNPVKGGNDMTTLNGTTVTLDKWKPGSPVTAMEGSYDSRFTTVAWGIDPDPTYSGQGLYNTQPTSSYPTTRPICVTSI